MMTTVLHGEKLLQNTEVELRRLLSEAAAAGDYESVMVLTRWASQVAQLYSRREKSPDTMVPSHAAAEQEGEVARRARRVRRTSKRRPIKTKQKCKRRNGASNGYPKFFRRGEEIIKVGWSKRSKSEYQHKAPQKVISLLTAAIAARATTGSLVAANELIPLRDPSDGEDIPDYQVYVCLAWLRHEALIEQEGRQGYLISDPSSLEKRADERWGVVPSK
jgi:hypothetical protein